MADTKGSALTTLAIDSLDPANDLLNPIDVSDTTMGAGGTNKKMTPKNLISKSLEDLAKTWNNGAVDFTAIKMNVTDTASGSGSLLFDLQVGGSSKAKITKAGNQTLAGTLVTGGDITIPVGSNLISTSAHVKLNANNVVVTYGGRYATFSGTLLDVSGGGSQGVRASYFRLGYTTDAYVYGDADNAIGMRNGTNPQTFNIHNTYTDASNYERGCLKWSSNVFEVGVEAAGTGSARELKLNSSSSVSIYKGATIYLDTGSYNMINMRRQTRFYATVIPHTTGIDIGSAGSSFRDLYLAPSASLTPSNNGDLCIEATNNTTLTFKYKGSDGTVRSGTVALS